MTIPIMTREQWEERIRYETIDENEPGKPRTAHPYYIVDTRKLWVPVTEAFPKEESEVYVFGKHDILEDYEVFFSIFDGKYFNFFQEKGPETITHWTYPLLPEDVK